MSQLVMFVSMNSPLGEMVLTSDGDAVTGIYTPGHPLCSQAAREGRKDAGPFREAMAEFSRYFSGDLKVFSFKRKAMGTAFQRRVWDGLEKIPFGERWSYGRLAQEIGVPDGSRAVGLANGKNPLSIVVPCHRVVGSDGALRGYAGGVEAKAWLLEHEQRVM